MLSSTPRSTLIRSTSFPRLLRSVRNPFLQFAQAIRTPMINPMNITRPATFSNSFWAAYLALPSIRTVKMDRSTMVMAMAHITPLQRPLRHGEGVSKAEGAACARSSLTSAEGMLRSRLDQWVAEWALSDRLGPLDLLDRTTGV
jgi:hypothetical protein